MDIGGGDLVSNYGFGGGTLPSGSSSGGGRSGYNWGQIGQGAGAVLGGLGGVFGSPGSDAQTRSVAPPSADELGLQGYLLNQLYYGGPNPAFSYGMGGMANLSQAGPDPTYQYGVGGIENMLNSGMTATGPQLDYLNQIRQNQISTGGNNIFQFLQDAQRQNRDSMLARGMDQSSVDLWGSDLANRAAVNQFGNIVGGANQQFAQGALQLPYQSAGLYSNLAGMGQGQRAQDIGLYGNIAGMGQQQGNIDMSNLMNMYNLIQRPRLQNTTTTDTGSRGSADTMGAAGSLLGGMGVLAGALA